MMLIIIILSSLIVVVSSASVPGLNFGRDAWLEDFENAARQNDLDAAWMQADSPFKSSRSGMKSDHDSPRCPPVPVLNDPSRPCSSQSSDTEVVECQTDAECSSYRGHKCCFDGCRRTCVVSLRPAPYIDWKYEPKLRFAAGKSWLIPGPGEVSEDVWCNPSYSDSDAEDPLLCPHGFVCQLDDDVDDDDAEHEDSAANDRGRCVRQTIGDSVESTHELLRNALRTEDPTSCLLADTGRMYKHGDMFHYARHPCKCDEGSVLCLVGEKTEWSPSDYGSSSTQVALQAKDNDQVED